MFTHIATHCSRNGAPTILEDAAGEGHPHQSLLVLRTWGDTFPIKEFKNKVVSWIYNAGLAQRMSRELQNKTLKLCGDKYYKKRGAGTQERAEEDNKLFKLYHEGEDPEYNPVEYLPPAPLPEPHTRPERCILLTASVEASKRARDMGITCFKISAQHDPERTARILGTPWDSYIRRTSMSSKAKHLIEETKAADSVIIDPSSGLKKQSLQAFVKHVTVNQTFIRTIGIEWRQVIALALRLIPNTWLARNRQTQAHPALEVLLGGSKRVALVTEAFHTIKQVLITNPIRVLLFVDHPVNIAQKMTYAHYANLLGLPVADHGVVYVEDRAHQPNTLGVFCSLRAGRTSMGFHTVTITKSQIPEKKFKACFTGTQGKKTVHFGAAGYEDFTIHNDQDRKNNYIRRHQGTEDWDAMDTPGALARWILWNKPTLAASVADFKRRFHLK